MEAISRQNSTNCSGWHGDFRWPGLVELCCSGKRAGLGFSSQQTVLPSGCLAGSAWPGLVKNISSLFISFSYPLYLTLRHIEGVCHLSSGSGLQPLDNKHFGLRVNLRHVVRGQVAVDVKVWYTHPRIDWSIIGHRWSSNLGLGASYDKETRLCKNWLNVLYQAVRILFNSFVLHQNIDQKLLGLKFVKKYWLEIYLRGTSGQFVPKRQDFCHGLYTGRGGGINKRRYFQ